MAPPQTKPKRKTESNSHPKDALRLLYFRRIFGLTQKQAADLLDVPQSSLRAYEGGRLPIPNSVRRRIGSISPVEILPMDSEQDPGEIYATVRRAHPDEFCDELKVLLPRITSSDQPPEHKQLEESQPVTAQRGLSLLEGHRKNRSYLQTMRRELSPFRRVYCEWRDATFFASAVFIFLWVNCLQLNIPLGMFTDAANAVGLGSLAVFSLLLIAVLQDLITDLGKRSAT